MKKNQNKAFTLIELMLVITLIVILSAIAIPRLTGKTEQARVAAAKSEIEATLSMALDLYELDAGAFPSTDQGLKALIIKPTTSPEPIAWNGPYLKKKTAPKDPWKNDYIYEFPGKNNEDYDLSSAGPDGITGNDDDITNWTSEEENS